MTATGDNKPAALVIGASAGLGRALSRILAEYRYDLLLVARNASDLEAEANHLRTVYDVKIVTVTADASAIESFVDAVQAAKSKFTDIRAILFPIGLSYRNDVGAMPVSNMRALIDVNFAAVAALTEALLPDLMAGEHVIVGFGSIAAVRGRSANVIYSAAKRALASYFESLRHRLAESQIRVQFYTLGYLDTQQSFGKQLFLPRIAPETIARSVVKNLDRDLGFVVRPRFWWPLLCFVRWLPWNLYRRLSF